MKKFARFIFCATALAIACAFTQSAALAAVTEIVAPFPNQTALMSPTAIMSPGNGNYFVAVSITASDGSTGVCPILQWVDPNGQNQSEGFCPNYELVNGFSTFISIESGSTPTIETIGTYSASYSVYVMGFGLLASVQGQGGLGEPISTTNIGLTGPLNRTLLTPASGGLYLVCAAMTGTTDGHAFVNWTDENGSETQRVAADVSAGSCTALHSLADDPITLTTTGSGTYNVYTKGISFGMPSSGSGPITDYNADFHSVNVTEAATVVTPSSSGMYLIMGQITEVPQNMEWGMDWYFNGGEGYPPIFAQETGQSRLFVQFQRLLGSTSFHYSTETVDPSYPLTDYNVDAEALNF